LQGIKSHALFMHTHNSLGKLRTFAYFLSWFPMHSIISLGGINFCPVAEKMSRFHISYKGFRPRWAWELATGSRSPSQVRMCVFLLQEKVLSMVKINCQPCCSLTLCLAINWKADPLRKSGFKYVRLTCPHTGKNFKMILFNYSKYVCIYWLLLKRKPIEI